VLLLANNDQESRGGRLGVSPGVFVIDDPGIHLIGYIWGATPIVFIVIRIFDIHFLSRELSDEIISTLSVVWPSITPQYEFIKRFSTLSDATNYALFYLLLLIQIGLATGYVAIRFKNASVPILRPGRGEFLVISIGFVASCYALFVDPVPANPGQPFYFRVDSAGFYYVRQWLFATAVWMTTMFALASLLQVLNPNKLDPSV